MKLFYIRHAPTEANVAGEIVRNYNEYDIKDFDREEWFKKVGNHIPKNFRLFTSPTKRCQQTAKALFPGKEYKIVEELEEFDVSALTDAGLKFWEIDEKTFKEKVYLCKYQVEERWQDALVEINSDLWDNDGNVAVVIGHGFYGRLVRSIYERDDDSIFNILNSKNFQFKNLDMMEIERCQVQKVYRS
jgi:broad specificity phosphatase PhoE